jgi:hypothetical protein
MALHKFDSFHKLCFYLFSGVLSDHSAKKFVIDFLRTIILDSFSQQSSPKPVLDVVLDVSVCYVLNTKKEDLLCHR